jgi:hypothetical protein
MGYLEGSKAKPFEDDEISTTPTDALEIAILSGGRIA